MDQRSFELFVSMLYLEQSIEKVRAILEEDERVAKARKIVTVEEGSIGDGRFSQETKSFLS